MELLETQVEATPADDGNSKRLDYPFGVFFIIGVEFCERFTFYGIRGILVLYLNKVLFYSQDQATITYHMFSGVVYMTCIAGAILADGYLGKLPTILFAKIIYTVGCKLLVLGTIGPLNLPVKLMTVLPLALIALGSGVMKPCIAAFGGDQFELPEQRREMSNFFSFFYFSVNAGALFAMFLTPILYHDLKCFGKPHCFALAFGLPTVMIVCALLMLLAGWPFYRIMPCEGTKSAIVGFVIVVRPENWSEYPELGSYYFQHALVTQTRQRKTNPQQHFLDYAQPKYGDQLIADIKALLRILTLYLAAPLFWALYEQKGSRWIFQAERMNRKIKGFEVKPEHMQLVNPILVLTFIPFFQYCVYPLLALIGIRRPLQKLFLGGIITSLSFLVSAIVQLYIEPPSFLTNQNGTSQLLIINGIPDCGYNIYTTIMIGPSFYSPPSSFSEKVEVNFEAGNHFNVELRPVHADCSAMVGTFSLRDVQDINFFITGNKSSPSIEVFYEKGKPVSNGQYFMRALFNDKNISNIYIVREGQNKHLRLKHKHLMSLDVANYDVVAEGKKLFSYQANYGETMTIMKTANGQVVKRITVAPEKRVHVFWQLPQYVLVSIGEILFSITGLEFSYSEAPISMKSVLQACWLISVAVGNIIVAIITKIRFFQSTAHEFFFFAALMFLNMLMFLYLANKYVPNKANHQEDGGSITV